MGRKRLEETRSRALHCYTTDSHADRVQEYVDQKHKDLSVSTWLLNLIKEVVPQDAPVEASPTHA